MNRLSHAPQSEFVARGFRADTADWPEALRREMREIGVRNLMIAERLKAVMDKLARAGVRPIVMKGCHLIQNVYPFGIRPIEDIDLLLDRRDYAKADRVLRELGYEDTIIGMDAWTHLEVSNKVTYLNGSQPVIPVDVHFSLGPFPYLGRLTHAELLSETEIVRAGDTDLLVLNPEMLLLHLCLHVFQHRKEHWQVSARDIAVVSAAFADRIRWDRFVDLVGKHALGLPVNHALEMASQIAEPAIPGPIRDRLAGLPASRKEQRIYKASLAMEDGVEKYLLQFLTLPGFTRKMQCLRRIIAPRKAFLKRHYKGNYLRYVADIGTKSLRALARSFR